MLVHSHASLSCIAIIGPTKHVSYRTPTTEHILSHYVTSPLYILLMNMFYGLYPVDTDVSDFTSCAYNAEIILRLATKPEMGWYARNMSELQSPNRTIGFMSPTRQLITHQATSWTQQLYKDTNTRRDAQKFHHPEPSAPLATTTVTDTMEECPFCDDSTPNHQPHLHGDIIYLHIHCTNEQLQLTRDASNTDIAVALKHLGALFQHAP